MGQVERRLSFSVSIPATDGYFIVLDNRTGQQAKAVQITVHAAPSGGDQLEVADKMLPEFERQFHQVFVFDPFLIRVERCGEPKAFRDESGIVLCTEYVRYSHDILNNKQMTQNALCFSIFHEVGRALLIKWNHPSSSKQEVCDEFATVLMVMLNQRQRISELAEYFVKNPKAPEALRKLFQDDRHPFSVERARRILRWLEDPQLVRSWQRALVPRMQTTLLRRLQQKPTPWTDLQIVEEELALTGKIYSRLQVPIPA
jgi:hypothetical protein